VWSTEDYVFLEGKIPITPKCLPIATLDKDLRKAAKLADVPLYLTEIV
jgi:hypothetical protein